MDQYTVELEVTPAFQKYVCWAAKLDAKVCSFPVTDTSIGLSKPELVLINSLSALPVHLNRGVRDTPEALSAGSIKTGVATLVGLLSVGESHDWKSNAEITIKNAVNEINFIENYPLIICEWVNIVLNLFKSSVVNNMFVSVIS